MMAHQCRVWTTWTTFLFDPYARAYDALTGSVVQVVQSAAMKGQGDGRR